MWIVIILFLLVWYLELIKLLLYFDIFNLLGLIDFIFFFCKLKILSCGNRRGILIVSVLSYE